MFGFSKRVKGRFGDLREQEGNVLGVVNLVVAAAMLGFLFKMMGTALPEWGARTVATVAQISAFAFKTVFFCWLFIWVRWSLPRFRYDQLMRLGWKQMIPLSFVNIFATGVILLLIDRM
jgi:NADH-quinone oxidoreductase subunit H